MSGSDESTIAYGLWVWEWKTARNNATRIGAWMPPDETMKTGVQLRERPGTVERKATDDLRTKGEPIRVATTRA